MSSNYGFQPTLDGLNTIDADNSNTNNLVCDTLQINITGTAPTKTAGDNTTNIATTAFVQNAISAGGGYVDLTTNQTVGGIKTFSSVPLCATAPTTGNMLCNKTYVDSFGVSTSSNNTWTGFNQFRQETGVFSGTTTNKLSMDINNPAITYSFGASSSCTNAGTMNPYNIVVPAGNYCRTVYMRIALDLLGEWPLLYTGNVSLTYSSVSVSIQKNGGAYGGSPTGTLINYTSLTKPWTGITSDKFRIKAYLGDIYVSFNIDTNNTSTDTYAINLTLTGTTTSSPSIAVTTSFLADWNALWTSTNTQTTGTFGGINPLYGSSYTDTNNTIVSKNDLSITSTNGLTIKGNSSLNLIADTSYWTAISNNIGNFYFRTFNSQTSIILGNQIAQDLFFIISETTGTSLQTTNQPITIYSGTAATTVNSDFNISANSTFNLAPPGTIMQGLYTSLSGYLLCNGASVSTTTYAKLFAVIGYNYGGSGASFNIPDFRGMFLRGNGSQTLGGITYTGGALSSAGAQNDQVLTSTAATNQGFRSCAAGARDAVARFQIGTDPVDTGTGILAQFPRQGTENRPANYSVNYFIRY